MPFKKRDPSVTGRLRLPWLPAEPCPRASGAVYADCCLLPATRWPDGGVYKAVSRAALWSRSMAAAGSRAAATRGLILEGSPHGPCRENERHGPAWFAPDLMNSINVSIASVSAALIRSTFSGHSDARNSTNWVNPLPTTDAEIVCRLASWF